MAVSRIFYKRLIGNCYHNIYFGYAFHGLFKNVSLTADYQAKVWENKSWGKPVPGKARTHSCEGPNV